MTYGIPMNTFPLTDEGELSLENHRQWVAKQHILDSMTFTNKEREIKSSPSGILLGGANFGRFGCSKHVDGATGALFLRSSFL
jgi:hypothetical protein